MNDYNIKKILYKNSIKIITLDDNKRLVFRVRRANVLDTYSYLSNRDFHDYLAPIEVNSAYEIYPYIDDISINDSDKAKDLVYVMALLHNKTTVYEDIDYDEIKSIYESLTNRLTYLDSYYHDLQDYIEEREFFSPEEYLLIRNISKIYASIYYSKNTLDKWYDIVKNKIRMRKCLTHNKLSLDHFLRDDKYYLIDWDLARCDYVVYDFYSFYKNEYEKVEMSSLFDMYQSKYRYTEDEYLLFTVLISIPEKIEFSGDHYIDTLKAKSIIDYIEGGDKFISKENQKYKTTQQDELNKEN